MKKLTSDIHISKDINMQENIRDLSEDLLAILESHLGQLPIEVIFGECFKLLTISLYECCESHREAFNILRKGMDEGILEALEKRDH